MLAPAIRIDAEGKGNVRTVISSQDFARGVDKKLGRDSRLVVKKFIQGLEPHGLEPVGWIEAGPAPFFCLRHGLKIKELDPRCKSAATARSVIGRAVPGIRRYNPRVI